VDRWKGWQKKRGKEEEEEEKKKKIEKARKEVRVVGVATTKKQKQVTTDVLGEAKERRNVDLA